MSIQLTDRKWNWLDDGILPYALALLRAIWVAVLIRMLSLILPNMRTDLISPIIVLALLIGSTLFAQYANFRTRSNAAALLIVAGGGLAAVCAAFYFSVPVRVAFWDPAWLRAVIDALATSFLILAVAAWLWRWGIVTVQAPLGYDTYVFNFLFGLIIFAVTIFIASAGRLVSPSSLVLPLLAFFALGLGTLTVASLASSRRYERAHSKQSFSLNRYWLGTVALIIGLILLTGFILGQLFAPDAAAHFIALVTSALDAMANVLGFILLVVAFVIFTPLAWLGSLVNIRINPSGASSGEEETWGEYVRKLQEEPYLGFSPEIFTALKIIALCLLIAIMLFVFVQAFRRFRGTGQEEIDEEHETLLSVDLLKKQLGALLARKPGASAAPVNPFVDLSGQAPGVQVRRVYQALLAWATERGFQRPAGATPGEYQSLLLRGLAIDARGLALITNAYVLARYSPESISAAQADEVARIWERLAQGIDPSDF